MQLLSYNEKACIINIIVNKYKASKISQSHGIVATVQIDEIIKDGYQPTNRETVLKKITY